MTVDYCRCCGSGGRLDAASRLCSNCFSVTGEAEDQRDALALALQHAEAQLAMLYFRGGLKNQRDRDEIGVCLTKVRRALKLVPDGLIGRLVREEDADERAQRG